MRHAWLGLTLCALGATACTKQEVACPSIYIAPHASITLSEPIAADGAFDVELSIDGQEQTCALTITDMAPSKEECEGASCTAQSPSTRADMTCEGIGVSGINNDGSIPGFTLANTPKSVSIRLVQQGRVRAEDTFALEYAPASLIGEGCPKTEHASATLTLRPLDASPPAAPPTTGGAALEAFDPARTYGGRIAVPPPDKVTSFVVHDDGAYDNLLERIPKNKIQKKRPADPSDDAILKRPAVDFSNEMIVVAVCGTFYCEIDLKGYRVEGDTLTVIIEAPGEDPGLAMGARPIGMNGEDAYGNYAAAVVPAHAGDVVFENASPEE
jgi:hypothetical protein